MAEKMIVGFVGVLCAAPFLVMAVLGRNSQTPLNFWSGDRSLSEKVGDVSAYNQAMSRMYFIYGLILLLTAFLAVFHVMIVIVLWTVEFTLGLYVLYRRYQRFLAVYGKISSDER